MNYKNIWLMGAGIALMALGILLAGAEMGFVKINLFQNLAEILKMTPAKNNCDVAIHLAIMFVGVVVTIIGIGPSKKIGSIPS